MATNKTSWYVLHAPETGTKYEEFHKSCYEAGVLDKITKELLLLALASVFRNPENVDKHLKGAIQAGATKTEITEVLLITAAESAGNQLTWAENLYCKYIGKT